MVDYAVTYGEFMYKAAKWSHPCRVAFKIEKPANQMTFMYTFIVTNMESEPYQAVWHTTSLTGSDVLLLQQACENSGSIQ